MKKKQLLTYFLNFLFLNFFIFTNLCLANNTEILINEIAWMGDENSSSNEWIEFFNIGTESIDIAEWSIYGADSNECLNFFDSDGNVSTIILPDDFLLYGNSEDFLDGVEIDIWDTTIGLGNTNPGNIQLFNDLDCSGDVVDEVINLDDWLAGDNDEKKTMERTDDGDWGTSQNTGGTPNLTNSIANNDSEEEGEDENNEEDEESEPVENDEDNKDVSTNSSSSGSSVRYKNYKEKSVLINEIVSDPNKGENEWVEIILNIESSVDLSNWEIVDASGSKTKISGTLSSNNKILVIEEIKGNLNNKGDEIFLKDGNGNIVDTLKYGEYSTQNIPAPENPYSLALKDGKYFITEKATKGEENIIEEVVENVVLSSADIVLNEIFPNPDGDDKNGEFIELYNKSSKDIDLKDWFLENKIGQKFVVGLSDFNNEKEYIIKSKGYFTVFRKNSYLVMNNNDDIIKLFSAKDKLVDSISYNNAESGWSYSSILNLDYEKINTTTKQFILHSINKNDFVWSKISTPYKNNIIKTRNNAPIIDFSFPEDILVGEEILFDSSDSIDVDGDKIDFVWDFGDVEISLPLVGHTFLEVGYFDVKLTASDGKSEVSVIKKVKVCDVDNCDLKKEANEDVEIEKVEKVADEVVDKVENTEIKIVEKSSDNNEGGNKKGFIEDKNNGAVQNDINFVKLENVRSEVQIGDKIMTIGIVSVVPGVLGTQFFYISGNGGLQVYSYQKSFPQLSVGDYIEVSGEISEKSNEKYLNIKDGGIRVLDNDKDLKADKVYSDQLLEDKIGMLVQLSGEIVDKKGSRIFFEDDVGDAIFYIKNSTDIKSKNIIKGERYDIMGIVNRYNDELRVLPRSEDDFLKIEGDRTEEEVKIKENKVEENGSEKPVENFSNVSSSVFTLDENSDARRVLKYTSIFLGIFLLVSIIVLFGR